MSGLVTAGGLVISVSSLTVLPVVLLEPHSDSVNGFGEEKTSKVSIAAEDGPGKEMFSNGIPPKSGQGLGAADPPLDSWSCVPAI